MAELHCVALTKRFGPVRAVAELSFAARAGEVTAFLGPNGAGKTTTLRMAVGLVTATAGEALIGGRPYPDLEAPPRVVRAGLGSSRAPPRRAGGPHPQSPPPSAPVRA